jgi:tetratricopeptide (TPR) repeat protein
MLERTRAAFFCAWLLALLLSQGEWALAPVLAGEAARNEKPEEALKDALAPKPPPEAVRKQRLGQFFERLRDARTPEEAQQIALSIQRLWLQTSSDTASLLMQRAAQALEAQNFPLGRELLEKLVLIEPDWAEAWNELATVKFMTGDLDGAMADFTEALQLEPRHFGALISVGLILQREGFDDRAREAFSKALKIYPLAPDIQKRLEEPAPEEGGKDI